LPWKSQEQAETYSLTKKKAHFKLAGLPSEWKWLATAHLPTPHEIASENLTTPETTLQ
jgi:hypothetical protein